MAEHAKAPDPRAVALQLLDAVLTRGRPLDEALAAAPDMTRMSQRDRAFARHLSATTLRRLGQLDALIERCLDRPLKRKSNELRNLLRLGACQLAVLGTPPHAAVSTTVTLARAPNLAGFRALINAVLRRMARELPELLAAQDAARLSTPDWLWQSWEQSYGPATTEAIAAAHLTEPPLDLTVKQDAAAWAETLDATLLPTGGLRLPPGTGEVASLAGYREGAWWVQDAAAALPARLLGDVADKTVVDLCAAPGGKTAQLAAAGARVTAVDRSPHRLKRLESNLARLGLAATTVVADAAQWRPAAHPDAVLLDAPCSATGTLRRHPDIAWLKGAADIAPLTALQDRLLDNAVAMLRPGGLLVYATCSLQREEGPDRIAALLARTKISLARVPLTPDDIAGLAESITPESDLRSLPCHLAESGGMDGFYASRLRRVS